MGELGALFNPGMRHELEERRSKAMRREEEGNARDGDLRIDLESGVAVIAVDGEEGESASATEDDSAGSDLEPADAGSAVGDSSASPANAGSAVADTAVSADTADPADTESEVDDIAVAANAGSAVDDTAIPAAAASAAGAPRVGASEFDSTAAGRRFRCAARGARGAPSARQARSRREPLLNDHLVPAPSRSGCGHPARQHPTT